MTAPSPNCQPAADVPDPCLRMRRQIDSAGGGGYSTSAAMVSSVIGGPSGRDYRSYGIPTVRYDLAAPNIKRVSDRVNYGDEANAFALVNPSIFSNRGVFEKHIMQPRSKEEVSLLKS